MPAKASFYTKMSSHHSTHNESTLANAAEHPGKSFPRNIFAVIIELSPPTFSQKEGHYHTRLKIIDQSFNFTHTSLQPSLKIHKYVILEIYTSSPETVPTITGIGDVIRLYSVRFTVKSNGELVANIDDQCEWRIFPAGPSSKPPLVSFNTPPHKKTNLSLTISEQNYLDFLTIWSNDFLSRNTLTNILWWNSIAQNEAGDPDLTKPQKNLDMILKCVKIQAKPKLVTFTNNKGNLFSFPFFKEDPLSKDLFYKLSGVDLASSNSSPHQLILKRTNLTSISQIPQFFKDVLIFKKLSQENLENISDSISNDSVFFRCQLKRPFNNFVTIIDDRYDKVPLKPFPDLFPILQNPFPYLNSQFVIEGEIREFSSTNLTQIAKRLVFMNQETYSFKSAFLKNLESIIIFNFVIRISGENSRDFLDVYICTGLLDSRIFDFWDILPDFRAVEQWRDISDKNVRKFESKLEKLEKSQKKIKVVVKLLVTKNGRSFLKMIDTVFC